MNEVIDGVDRLMYGSPTTTYRIKGKVTDENGNTLQGVKVTAAAIVSKPEDPTVMGTRQIAESTETETGGTYVVGTGFYPVKTLRIYAEDVDGAANGGEFAKDSIDVQVTIVKDEEKAKKIPWYAGEADVQVPDIKLKKK